jgi:predicted phage terminase large subunit-like protein
MRYVNPKRCRRFGVVDLAFTLKKENDFNAIGAFAVTTRNELLVLDVHKERMEGPDIPRSIAAMYRKWDLPYVAVEANQAQIVVVQELRRLPWNLTVRALRADVDKLSRAIPATVLMESGQLFVPEGAPWLDDFITELLAFPHGAHDDQVDMLAYAAIEAQRFGAAAEPESYRELRGYSEKELAAEFFNRADNPIFWQGDEDVE